MVGRRGWLCIGSPEDARVSRGCTTEHAGVCRGWTTEDPGVCRECVYTRPRDAKDLSHMCQGPGFRS
jgi:hypothetical protein